MIKIEKNNNRGQSRIITNLDWFKTDTVIVELHEDYMSFKKPTLDYKGKTYKVLKHGNAVAVKVMLPVPHGEFELDEEDSNEDELTFNF